MPPWILALGGLLVWTAHFFGCYLIASVWLTTPTAAAATLAITAVGLAANGWLLWRTAPARRGGLDGFDRWLAVLGYWGAGLSMLAVLWQGLPALFV